MIPGTWYLGVLVQTLEGFFPNEALKKTGEFWAGGATPTAIPVQNVSSSCRAAAADTSPICCAPVTMKSTCQQTGCMQSGENCVVQTIRTNKMDCSID